MRARCAWLLLAGLLLAGCEPTPGGAEFLLDEATGTMLLRENRAFLSHGDVFYPAALCAVCLLGSTLVFVRSSVSHALHRLRREPATARSRETRDVVLISGGGVLLSLLFAGVLLWSCQRSELLVELRSGAMEHRTYFLGKLRRSEWLSVREIRSLCVSPEPPAGLLGGVAIEFEGGDVLEFDQEGFKIKEARRIAGEMARVLRVPLGRDKAIWWPRGCPVGKE